MSDMADECIRILREQVSTLLEQLSDKDAALKEAETNFSRLHESSLKVEAENIKLRDELDKHREFFKVFEVWAGMETEEGDLTDDIVGAYQEMIEISESITPPEE